ncbi:Hypothetical predicted protein [Pelobates cultripes]|uniref:Uncharacterized protein n=1 Tax=Pelobates cultripes TaxID=61616 RepID=A0AAD1WPX2_PELCU|nr:Hypothetical predicted protein [Pelobates cultripes]
MPLHWAETAAWGARCHLIQLRYLSSGKPDLPQDTRGSHLHNCHPCTRVAPAVRLKHPTTFNVGEAPVAEATAVNGATTPATKQDIHNLFAHFKDLFTAELNLVKIEMQAIINRHQASEEHKINLKQDMQAQAESLQHLQTLHSQLTTRVDLLEDRGWQKNVNISGVADSIPTDELPQFIRCLIATVLPAKFAKQFVYDWLCQISKSSEAPNNDPRDIIICYLTYAEKHWLLYVLRGKIPTPIRIPYDYLLSRSDQSDTLMEEID